MKRWRYARDPLCLLAIALYALNRWGLKPHLVGGFFHDHFNDLLLIPAALPFVLWAQRRLGWRPHDGPPGAGEIGLHLLVWGLLCEVAGPYLVAHATGDWRDLVAYAAGALVAGVWWQTAAKVGRARRARRDDAHAIDDAAASAKPPYPLPDC